MHVCMYIQYVLYACMYIFDYIYSVLILNSTLITSHRFPPPPSTTPLPLPPPPPQELVEMTDKNEVLQQLLGVSVEKIAVLESMLLESAKVVREAHAEQAASVAASKNSAVAAVKSELDSLITMINSAVTEVSIYIRLITSRCTHNHCYIQYMRIFFVYL